MAETAHPVIVTTTAGLRRSRVKTFFMYVVMIPHLFFAQFYGLAASFMLFFGWFAAMWSGRLPAGIHKFTSEYLKYSGRTSAFMMMLAHKYPPFGAAGQYEVDEHFPPQPQKQSRLSILFRGLLIIPAAIAYFFYMIPIAFAAGFVALYAIIMGRVPQWWQNYGLRMHVRTAQLSAYSVWLTDAYPELGGIETPQPPLDGAPLDPIAQMRAQETIGATG